VYSDNDRRSVLVLEYVGWAATLTTGGVDIVKNAARSDLMNAVLGPPLFLTVSWVARVAADIHQEALKVRVWKSTNLETLVLTE